MKIRSIVSRILRKLGLLKQPPQMFAPDPDRDVYLVSYPRSGNTWLRAMIAQLLTGKSPASLRELDYLIPDIYYKVPVAAIPSMPFYVVKSHEPLRLDAGSGKYRKVIYIVRDPRDVAVSYYRYSTNNGMPDTGLEQYAKDFANGRIFPGSWQEHVESWTGGRGDNNGKMLVLKYEEILEQPARKLMEIARFLSIQIDAAGAEQITSQCSRAEMVNMEKAGNRPEDESGSLYFIGKGEKGDWAQSLSPEAAEEIRRLAEPTMRRFGYL